MFVLLVFINEFFDPQFLLKISFVFVNIKKVLLLPKLALKPLEMISIGKWKWYIPGQKELNFQPNENEDHRPFW